MAMAPPFCLAAIVPSMPANEKCQRQNRKAARILRLPVTLWLLSAALQLKGMAQQLACAPYGYMPFPVDRFHASGEQMRFKS